MSTEYVFYINGINCAKCQSTIETNLKKWLKEEPSLTFAAFSVDLKTGDPKKATLFIDDRGQEYKMVWEKIQGKINESHHCESYNYSLQKNQPSGFFNKLRASLVQIARSHVFLGALGCVSGIALISTMLVTGGLPLMAMVPLAGLSVLLTLALGARSYYDAWQKLVKTKSLTMDSLFAISTASVLVVSIMAFFVPWLPMMFEAGLLIYGFRHIGIAIKEKIKEEINSGRFQDKVPKSVNLCTENTVSDANLNDIRPNDVILIHPGEIIPLDGICLAEGLIDKTIITGSRLPHFFRTGDTVLAGMILGEHDRPLAIRVTKTAKESYLARLDESITRSILEKAPLQLKADQLLTYFIPTVIAIALFSGLIIGVFFTPALAIHCAISVLVSACPCTLGLVIPLAIDTGMTKAAGNGVPFKNARILQEAEQIDTVVFDLNGTLTTGIPSVQECKVLENAGISKADLLALGRALEQDSKHPIGKAIRSYSESKSSQKFAAINLDYTNHSGITALVNEKKYSIGSRTLMEEKGVSTELIESIEKELALVAGASLVFIAQENTLLGYLILQTPLREGAKETISALIAMGKEVHLCTGADDPTAKRYAKDLGISKVKANCMGSSIDSGDTANSKPDYIESLKVENKKVAMVGDAANDAAAMAASNFGIAVISEGSDEITQSCAGATIKSNSLLSILSLFAISEQTVSNIKQNLILSMSYNLAAVLVAGGLLVAFGVTLNPGVGVALMAIQACVVLLNVCRFKHQSLPDLQVKSLEKKESISSYHIINTNMPERKETLNPELESNQTVSGVQLDTANSAGNSNSTGGENSNLSEFIPNLMIN